jgi:hypothetical protein
MTLFFASCDCAGKLKIPSSSGKHLPGCPMDSNCSFCGQKQFFCNMMKRCFGIKKTGKFDEEKLEKRIDKMVLFNDEYNGFYTKLKVLINQGYLDKKNKDVITSLNQEHNLLCDKLSFTADDIVRAETILFRIKRIYIVQKALSNKLISDAALQLDAAVNVDDFGTLVRESN